MKLLVQNNVVVGYTADKFADSQADAYTTVVDSVFVNKFNQEISLEKPNDLNNWLLLTPEIFKHGITATPDGWVYVQPQSNVSARSYDVPAWAAKAALDEAGLLDTVNNAIDASKLDSSTDNILYHKWYNATSFNSNDPDLKTFAANNGIEDKLKALFEKALDISNKRGAYAKT